VNEAREKDDVRTVRGIFGEHELWCRGSGSALRAVAAPLCEEPPAPALDHKIVRHTAAPAPSLGTNDLPPLTELGGYLALFALALVLGLLTAGSGCATSLESHERMAALVHSAVRACKEDGTTCPSALLCARAARDAGRAIQAARQLQADGREDAEVTARALAAQRVAQDACRRAGLKGELR
jgi:hypothetical protein